ncbi:hypothetical protein CO674_07805 [Rhizobium hidalgonense]|uniref:Uncharacterized protein n=1 Tax=Rhizobium hidalgonense TaxID=1538159 RepID=A0ABX4JV88_9HYPH|nr:hypothetical protein CO674_07805 [Rhizobium hidalgonense]RWX20081.1 hypothetical protein EHI42_02610 [Rhizobium hidalgonense]
MSSFHEAAPAPAHESIEYIRTPTEPQKITGVSIIPAKKIFVTAKLRNSTHAATTYCSSVSWL